MADKQADRDAFAQKFQVELAKLAPKESYRYDRENFRLVYGESDEAFLNLANVYDHYVKAPFWKRKSQLARHVRSFATISNQSLETSSSDARSQLVLKLRERIVIEDLLLKRQFEGKGGFTFAYKIVGEHLTLEVALDMPTSIRSVGDEDLAEWGVTFDEALAQANQNLLRAGTNRFRMVRPGVYASNWNDDYDCCRMVLPEILSSVPLKGRPVAMVPNRNCLLLSSADDANGLANMAKVAEDALKQPSSMCGIAFRLDNAWVPFLPPRDHPAFTSLHRLAVRSYYQYYENQKDCLDKLNNKQGKDIFVASPLVIEDKATGAYQSVATWGAGIPTLLPRADYIGFLRPLPDGESDVVGKARWEEAQPLLSDLMERQEAYPERYLIQGFPSKEQFAAMRLEPLA